MKEKGLEKKPTIERDGPETVNVGDLVTLKEPPQPDPAPYYRVLGFIEHPGNRLTVWLGSGSLPPNASQQFVHFINEGLPLPERFRNAFAVDSMNLEKVLDS